MEADSEFGAALLANAPCPSILTGVLVRGRGEWRPEVRVEHVGERTDLRLQRRRWRRLHVVLWGWRRENIAISKETMLTGNK